MRFDSSLSLFVVFALIADLCIAQSSTTTSSPPTTTTSTTTPQNSSYTVSVVNVTTTIVEPLSSGTRALTRSTTIVTTFRSTQYLTPSTTSTTTSTTTSSASPSATTTAPPVIHLATRVDGAFAVLGVLLVLTGLPTAFMGHKNRWSSFFLLGFYSFMAVTGMVILRFGVLDRKEQQLSLPDAKSRGLYIFACAVSGFVGGFISIFFWQLAKYLIGALGGFAVALWIQCLRNSGLIRPVGFRWLMYIACGVAGFALCTIPRLHYHTLLASTAVVGATAFMLGVDCFTTAGLKEFYIWNLGFNNLFPVLKPVGFVVSQTIAIELGLIAAIALAGGAVQLRLLTVLRVRLRELTEEHRRRDAELEAQAADRFKDIDAAREEWEKKHGRGDSVDAKSAGASFTAPLAASEDAHTEGLGTPGTTAAGPISSVLSLPGAVGRTSMQLSDRRSQSPGALPALDLGNAVKDELPGNMIDKSTMFDDHPEIRDRQHLVDEIRQIRRSLDALGSHPRDTRSERHSFGDLETTMTAARTASSIAARAIDGPVARERVRSMHLLPTTRPTSTAFASGSRAATLSTPSSRPSSVPLADDDWGSYVRERKLFQPPSGVTPPIQPSNVPEALRPNASINRQTAPRIPPSQAVVSALADRQRRETLFDPSPLPAQRESAAGSGGSGIGTGSAQGEAAGDSQKSWISNKSDTPAVPAVAAQGPTPRPGRSADLVRAPTVNTSTALQNQPLSPITILPPARSASQQQPQAQPRSPTQPAERVLTFEEYTERHKARMHALQEPLTRQEHKEATLADARARWEHSKAIESRVMARKQAGEAAQAETRLRAEREADKEDRRRVRRDSKGANKNLAPGRATSPASPSSPKREHRRNSLSLDKLSTHRISTHVKVEEWQKYQAAVGPDGGTRGAGPSPPTPPASPRLGHPH